MTQPASADTSQAPDNTSEASGTTFSSKGHVPPVASGSGAPAKPTASELAYDMPGQTLSVSLLEANGNVVGRTTVPVYGSATNGVFVGDLVSGGIAWRGDSVSVQIGTKFDKNHKPIEGVPLDKWAHQHGGRAARFVIVMVEGGSRGDSEKQKASDREGMRRDRQQESPAVSSSGPTGAGAAPSTEKRDPGPGGDDRETHDGTTNQPGRSGPGKIDGGTKVGTRTHGHEGGVASGGHGGEFGKSDGNKKDVGIMWDPRNAHQGQEDVAPENASPDGMAGGDETKKTGEGVPEAWGWKPLIKVPKSMREAVSIGLILLQADVVSIADGLVGLARKLGAVATKDFLRPLVRKEVEGLVERNLPKAVETLSKDAAYAGKSTAELEKIAKESLREQAAEELAKNLDHRIADAEKYAQSDRAQLGTGNAQYAADDLAEEEAELVALKKVRGAVEDEASAMNTAVEEEPREAVGRSQHERYKTELRQSMEAVGGRLHAQKGRDTIAALKRWIKTHPAATRTDMAAAENMILDLEDALK